MARAYTPAELLAKVYQTIPWSKKWRDAFGEPEVNGIWIANGNSTNGKSSFIMDVSKELAIHLGKGFLNAYEEGTKITLQDLIKQSGLVQVNGRMGIRKERVSDMILRAKKLKSPKFYIIDSVQASRMTRKEYQQIQELSEKKLFIFISRASGKNPKGKLAEDIWYDADLKIWIEGYKAISMGRHNPGGEYVI